MSEFAQLRVRNLMLLSRGLGKTLVLEQFQYCVCY